MWRVCLMCQVRSVQTVNNWRLLVVVMPCLLSHLTLLGLNNHINSLNFSVGSFRSQSNSWKKQSIASSSCKKWTNRGNSLRVTSSNWLQPLLLNNQMFSVQLLLKSKRWASRTTHSRTLSNPRILWQFCRKKGNLELIWLSLNDFNCVLLY